MSEHIGAEEAQALLDAATPLLHRNLRITTTQDCLFGEPDVEDDTYCVYDADEDDPPIVDRIVLPEMAELFAAAPRLAAEVVRLRRELDARTDPSPVARYAAECRAKCTHPAQGHDGLLRCGDEFSTAEGEQAFAFCGFHFGPLLGGGE